MLNKLTIILVASLAICLSIIGALGYNAWSPKSEYEAFKSDNSKLITANANQINESKIKTTAPLIVNWEPSLDFTNLNQDVDQLISAFMNVGNNVFGQLNNHSIDVKVEEKPDKYFVVVSIPEGQTVTLNTELEGNQLFIEGEVSRESSLREQGEESSLKQSIRFSRTLTLGGQIDKFGMKVANEDSKYTITIPKV